MGKLLVNAVGFVSLGTALKYAALTAADFKRERKFFESIPISNNAQVRDTIAPAMPTD